jgi:hypothetical protein
MDNPKTLKERKLARVNALWTERSSWDPHWREISQYQQPRAGRFVVTDRNKGDKRANSIYDNTPIFAQRTLSAGMMSGMTSPARPWFKTALADKDLMEFGPVKSWLHRVSALLRDVFAASNTYRALHTVYDELGLFGTACNIMLPDFDNVVHHYPLTVGEYALATNDKGLVDAVARKYQMTVGQMVTQFGLKNCSATVQNLYNQHNLDTWVDVVHLIEPRTERNRMKQDPKNMAFASCYFEPGRDNTDIFLRESGFTKFPALAPRWRVNGNDIYGDSPGMECLGDVKQLQFEQLRKSQAIDYQTNPPLQVPTAYKNQTMNRLPGGVSYVDATTQGGGIRSAFEVNLDINALLMDIQDVRERIRSAYYADLFLMLANDTRSGVTATEVAERHEEKLLMLGPVLERLHNELLSPMIELAFDYCARANILPEAPPEIQGMDLNVEFISTLAQAQRAVSAGSVDRLLGTVGQVAGAKGDLSVWDKIDVDQAIDDYAEMYGVNPEIIRDDDVVAGMRQQRAQEQAAAQAAAAAPVAADTAKTVSEIDSQGMQDVINQFQGYSTPSPAMV